MKTTSSTRLEPDTLATLIRRRDRAETELNEARKRLAADAPKADCRSLAYHLIRLAEHEGRSFVLRNVIHLDESNKADQIPDWLMTYATRGAGDSWSGRVNDVARAHHDGVLAAMREVDQELNAI